MAKRELPFSKRDIISLDITGITHSGYGIGRSGGLAVFVPGAVPGDSIRAEVTGLKGNYATARLLDITGPSPLRREPRCTFFLSCGGCRLQNVDYAGQLRLKTGLVRDSLSRIAGLGGAVVNDTIGMDDPWHYRNKAQCQVIESRGALRLGFFSEGSHRPGAFLGEGGGQCLLVDRDLSQTAPVVERLLNKYKKGTGGNGGKPFFRHVILRKGAAGQIMAVIVTAPG